MMKEKLKELSGKEEIDAIVWAATLENKSYGKFVQTMTETDKIRIYRAYAPHLERKEKRIWQPKRARPSRESPGAWVSWDGWRSSPEGDS